MNTTLLGIDVGSKELVTARRGKDQAPLLKTFANTPAGRQKLVALLKESTAPGGTIRVCLEATGAYSLEVALLLAGVDGCQVMVSNPITIKSFLRARGLRAKTDRIDAIGILTFLETMEFRPWTPPKAAYLQLQATARRIYQINAEKCREENRLEALEVSGIQAKALTGDIRRSIAGFERRILALEKAAMEIIKSDPELERCFELMISIKGIAKRSAIRLLGELALLPKDMKAPQWVAQAGLDPRVRQSGSSLDGHRYISKAGNRYIRAALFMPAMVAIQKEPAATAFYSFLVEKRGKKKMIAITAVMRKLLTSLHGMLKSNTPFNPDKFRNPTT